MEDDNAVPPKMGPEEQRAFQQTLELLHRDARNLALGSLASVVSLCDVKDGSQDEPSLVQANRGHHALFGALEKLDKLETDTTELESDTVTSITRLVTGAPSTEYKCTKDALQALQTLGASIPRRVCQHPFRKSDIVWVCRTCQSDETCVLCHACFSQSHHDGHDVAFYHAQAGGCCDCGDPDAWDPAGFCPHHGPCENGPRLEQEFIQRVRGVVPACGEWLVTEIAQQALVAHERTLVSSKSLQKSESMPLSPYSNERMTRRQYSAHQANDSDSSDGFGDNDDSDDAMVLDHVFSPSAASTSKSRHGTAQDNITTAQTPTLSQQLGEAGRQGHGLFLVLHSDDIHTTAQLVDALRELLGSSSYYTDSLLGRFVRSVRQHGQLVVWGTMELLAECSSNLVDLWLDGDRVACARIGAVMLDRAGRLVKHGLNCSIHTLQELWLEQRAVAVLEWLTALARSCDPLCQTVAESLRAQEHLVPMLNADFQLGARITKSWHSLLLTLLAVPIFKSRLAAAYCDTYRHVTAEYARGMGVLERSGYTLSVQFLNRVTYVVGLVQGRDLLGKLGKSLLETLSVAAKQSRGSNNILPRLNPNHFVLTHRRYSPCISDLKCVLNVKGMARLFASTAGTFLTDWIQALSLAQNMDAQVWRSWSQGHVEVEPRGWVGAFNASISLGSLFERLLSWNDDDASPIDEKVSPLARNLQSCVSLTCFVLSNGLATWQKSEMLSYHSTTNTSMLEPHRRCTASLSLSTIAHRHGSALAMRAMPVSQSASWSFHLPLHRFVAACLREVCRRPGDHSMKELLSLLGDTMVESQRDLLFYGLMEFPVLILTRAAQVRAGLWRRNGPGMHDQVLNYGEPPFCRALRDADLLLLQFAVLERTLHQSGDGAKDSDVGCCFLVHLLLHRLGLFDFVGFAKAPNSDFARYSEEVSAGMYPAEQQPEETATACHSAPLVLPWTYTPAKDVASCLSLLEEFLHMLIVLITELPPVPPRDKADHTSQAKRRLRREVVHRLASGPKTHSELAEVHHVLSHWDNVCLSEEGKMLNPDDATGAGLETALSEVADRKSSRGKLAPDQWELRRSAWDDYDPSFFHISLRSHQSAAENRPKPPPSKDPTPVGVESQPYAPQVSSKYHSHFRRLRRDITADAAVLAITYRTLHVHCRNVESSRDMTDLRGKSAYDNDAMSEIALARSVHLLTLGAFAWQETETFESWRNHGGGSVGSVFHDVENDTPSAREWVAAALLSNPRDLMDDEWYNGEDSALLLLRRLAVDGGSSGGFVAQDRAVRSGAAWLCDFAVKHNTDAAKLIGAKTAASAGSTDKKETDLERRKREAKARAMERMKAQAAKFINANTGATGDSDDNNESKQALEDGGATLSRMRSMSQSSEASMFSSSSAASPARSEGSWAVVGGTPGDPKHYDTEKIPERLLKHRPQCIICVDEGGHRGSLDTNTSREEEEGHRKRTRRKADGSNALGFVGYAQASTVLKGGGGPPPSSDSSTVVSAVRRFVGTHVTLCGHAIHSDCSQSYLATQREDRSTWKREEFRCPLCQRLSNCLVPFIDVGVDWVDPPTCLPVSENTTTDVAQARLKSCDSDAMSIEVNSSSENEEPRVALHEFLSNTPWWVSRNDDSVVWDGRCAFIASQQSSEDSTIPQLPTEDDVGERELSMDVDTSPPKILRRRSVRSLRKKDLYSAWNAMMRTPRFIRRRQRQKSNDAPEETASTATDGRAAASTQWLGADESSSGETVVWRRLMDLVADVAYRADGKRLGEEYLHSNFGEFRHYQVEKYAYNAPNRAAGIENIEWPACISSTTLPDSRKQELAREKALSKLLISVQSLTYSICSEASEARRLVREFSVSFDGLDGMEQDAGSVQDLCSKFGIGGFTCDGQLVLMPTPSASEDEGKQPFNGRLGRLRYFGLAVMAAAGAVSADLVQLVLGFPLDGSSLHENTAVEGMTASSMDVDQPLRAPIVYPVLCGHVLTHVVAAMCAACGRARARSDSLEFVWPLPFSRQGSFYGAAPEEVGNVDKIDGIMKDCEGFIKLGLLARVLQVLLGNLGFGPGGEHWEDASEVGPILVEVLKQSLNGGATPEREEEDTSGLNDWLHFCLVLLEVVLSNKTNSQHVDIDTKLSSRESTWVEQYYEASSIAANAATSYLADAGAIVQILVPGAVSRYAPSTGSEGSSGREGHGATRSLDTLEKLRIHLGLEPLDEMLKSALVREVLKNWFESARRHYERAKSTQQTDLLDSSLHKRLFKTEGFRVLDWPMKSAQDHIGDRVLKPSLLEVRAEPHSDDIRPMEIETFPARIRAPQHEMRTPKAGIFPAYTSKKLVSLIDGFYDGGDGMPKGSARPRISMLPTSYTDLYAELGTLCPDSDQIGLCLVCGEVLNAGGKSECTKHSIKCGAGAGIFFLLQECVGLIMHGGKAAYVLSPYVDSHGETPQYRGRPLNLDLERYNILHEMWSGHTVRQKVTAERGSSRQVIISDFY